MAVTLEDKRKQFRLGSNNFHTCIGTEALATIIADNYYAKCNIGLQEGDIVLFRGSDKKQVLAQVKEATRETLKFEKMILETA